MIALLLLIPLQLFGAMEETALIQCGVPQIEVLQIRGSAITLPEVTTNHLQQGYVGKNKGLKFDVSSNCPWQVSLSVQETDLGGPNGYAKPISDLKFRENGTQDQYSFSQQPTVLKTSSEGTSKIRVLVDIGMAVSWEGDPPGTYGATIIVTLGAQP